MAVGRFSGQMLTERFSETVVIVWAALIASVGALIAASAPSPAVAYVGFGVLGLGVSVIGPIGLALVGQIVSSHYRTEAISRAAVIGFSGFFVAPVLMGTVSEFYGLRVAFTCVAGFLLLALPMTALVKRLKIS
jgi:MFS family permease